MCCVASVGGVLWWGTARASQAGATPTAAVLEVLGSLEALSDDIGGRVIVFLCDEHEDELLAELRAIREALICADSSYDLESVHFQETTTDVGVTVTVDVSIVVSVGDGLFAHSEKVRWTFQTVNDRGLFSTSKGWKVCGMQIRDVCETFVRCQ